MARKNNRLKTEYHRGLGFDPRKYITAPAKLVHHKQTEASRTPQRGDIWFANLGSHPQSSVQSGCRPVIVISNNIGNAHADTVNVLPLTRHMKKPDLPCHTELTPGDITDTHQILDTSMILAEQITTIGKNTLLNYVGKIADTAVLNRIDHAMLTQLGRGHKEECKCL